MSKVIHMPEMEVGKSYIAVASIGSPIGDAIYLVVEINHSKRELKTIDNNGGAYTWFLEYGEYCKTYWEEV